LSSKETVPQRTVDEYPRAWLWDEDGDRFEGRFVGMTTGHAPMSGETPILQAKLAETGEEVSVWLYGVALRGAFLREVKRRTSKRLEEGELIVIARGEKRPSKTDPSRTVQPFTVKFPEAPEQSMLDMLEGDEADAADEEDDGIPF
jgi:hypothetical protein